MIARAEGSENGTVSCSRRDLWQYRHNDENGLRELPITDIRYVHHPSFCLPGAKDRLWGPHRQEVPMSWYSLPQEINEDGGNGRPKRDTLRAKQEKTLFLRYNYAKYRLSKLPHHRISSRASRIRQEAATWRKRAESTRDQIVHANLPLVPSMAQRYAPSGVEFEDLVSEGNMALLRAIEHFDVSRGFKFSTYACRAIVSCFHRLGAKSQRYRKHVPVNFDPEWQEGDAIDRRHNQQLDSAVASVREVVLRNRADLTGTELAVLLGRFPILAGGTRLTLAQLGKQVGVSNERVRQIEGACLLKLREAMGEHFAT